MTSPVRIQLSRRKGFHLQAVSRALNGLPAARVDRATRFGNLSGCAWPGTCGRTADCRAAGCDWCCVDAYRDYIEMGLAGRASPGAKATLNLCLDHEAGYPYRTRLIGALPSIKGHNLACWCALDRPCHADVLLEIANR